MGSAQLGTGQNAHAAAGVDIFLFAACFASMIVKKIWLPQIQVSD